VFGVAGSLDIILKALPGVFWRDMLGSRQTSIAWSLFDENATNTNNYSALMCGGSSRLQLTETKELLDISFNAILVAMQAGLWGN
jgi:hypothetical protein